MGLFGSIWSKIVDAAEGMVGAAQAASNASASASEASPAPVGAPVDVDAALTELASRKGGGGNWRSSIVDLLKLLDLDSSLAARKSLADELNVHVGADGSVEENTALHRAVMRKVAENGGRVPESLKA